MLYQSKTAKRRLTPPVPYAHGMKAVAIFEHKFTQDYVAATDILEIGTLPATARITNATLLATGMTTANTADVGLMDGDAGEYDETRVSGDELFSAAPIDGAEQEASLATCLAVAPENAHRGIGVTLSANEGAAADKTITLVIEYTY